MALSYSIDRVDENGKELLTSDTMNKQTATRLYFCIKENAQIRFCFCTLLCPPAKGAAVLFVVRWDLNGSGRE